MTNFPTPPNPGISKNLGDAFRPPLAESRPLHELSDMAPGPPEIYANFTDVYYPFFTEECAQQYAQAAESRVGSPEFSATENRVALLIGEGALLPALAYIPEETIVIADSNQKVLHHVQNVIDALRDCSTPQEWFDYMGVDKPFHNSYTQNSKQNLRAQVLEWQTAGFVHPLGDFATSTAAYQKARELIAGKAIVPWRMEIGYPEDVDELAKALRSMNGHITLANFSNLPAMKKFRDPNNFTASLSELPFTPHAAILATAGRIRKPRTQEEDEFWFQNPDSGSLQSRGPFYGLDDLASNYEPN